MRNLRPILLVSALSLAAGCALLDRTYRPPHAPKAEAAKVKFPWGSPREVVILSGVWLRAVTMALDDYLPEEGAERARGEDEMAACMARRDSYYVEAFVWSPRGASDAGDAGDGGAAKVESGGSNPEVDAGYQMDSGHGDAFAQPGMPKTPPIIYVSISLIADCGFGESPLLDAGALYAIDTVNWRILAIRR